MVKKSQKKRGRPKKWEVRNLRGRYPFMSAANSYLEAMNGVFADSTYDELERRLRRMNEDLTYLWKSGAIKSVDPNKLIDKDILAYISLLRSRGMKDSGIDHNLDGLNGLCRFIGNSAVDQAKRRFKQHFPKGTQPRLDPISDEDRAKIISAANLVDTNFPKRGLKNKEWKRIEAYGMAVLAICSGLRPKELRTCTVRDLTIKSDRMATIHAEEVKGKGRYGEPRNSAIHPDGIPFLRRYLKVRQEVLMNEYLVTELLFPAIQDILAKGDGVLCNNGTSYLRKIVMKEIGVDFDLRGCRRTFGQVCIDEKVPLDAVSRMMGHATTKTTELYYARKKNEAAIEEAQKVWGASNQPALESPTRPAADLAQKGKDSTKVNSPQTGKRFWDAGYA